ncbi:MAG: hypothetical protein GC190_13805 [Alphaproteobacteria bacterium]|nr:hypothetical protein [Alphaproteobacteria bacterium]
MKRAIVLMSAASLLAAGTAFAAHYDRLPEDQPTTIDGIDVACTGVGDEAMSDPRWRDYSVRLEFAGGNREYLADLDVSIETQDGQELLAVHCSGPWVLADLDPGKYRVRATYERNLTKSVLITAPSHGQKRVVIAFPEVTGD